MADDQARRGVLLDVAARGMVPVLGGCAGALAGGPEGGVIGVVVGQVVEKAINYFGENIVVGWHAFFGGKPPAERIAALAELASLTPEQARQQADQLFDEMRLDVRPEDRAVAVEYLSALPRAVDRAILRDERTGAVSLSLSVGLDKPEDMLALLPTDVPPYRVPGELPGSPYRLESLLGSGGFGAVYKASSASLQHLPLAVKVCLDPAMSESLKAERDNLERLMKAGHAEGAKRVVKLYGYDLDRSRPYLVYEYIPGGDLTQHLTRQRAQLGRNLKPAEVLLLMVQVVEGLVFAHRHGLIHRDLKPANILVDGETLKLADFGLGSVCATRAVMTSRIGMSTVGQLSFADQVSLFRGAGTPLYMSPEQRKGGMPDPKHDLYSLGVMWFQLLTGDVTRELHAGWAKELVVKYSVPRDHIDMIERCVGWFDERPKDAGELLALLKSLGEKLVPAPAEVRPPPVPMLSISSHDPVRRDKLQIWLGRLQDAHKAIQSGARPFKHWVTCALIWLGALMVVTGACIIPLESLRIPRNETNGVFVALFILGLSSVAAWLVDLKLTRRRRDQQQAALDEAIQTLKTEYPVEVAQWGGEATLREAALVGPIVERTRSASFIVSAASSIPPPKSTPVAASLPSSKGESRLRKVLLVSLLRKLAEAHNGLVQLMRPRLGAIMLIALGVGWLAGSLFGEVIYSLMNPTYGFLNLGGYRPFRIQPFWAGLGMGCLVYGATVGILLGLREARRSAARKVVIECEKELTDEFPGVPREWGATALLRDPLALNALATRIETTTTAVDLAALAPQVRQDLQLAALERIDAIHSRIAARPTWWKILAVAVAVGWGGGTLFGELVFSTRNPTYGFLEWERFRPFDFGPIAAGVAIGLVLLGSFTAGQFGVWLHRQKQIKAELTRETHELAEAYPALVAEWGGEAVLRNQAALQEVRRELRNDGAR